MTGQLIATARWRALDRDGTDTCRLSHADHGWLLVGHARFRDSDGFAALDYVIRCAEDWTTLGADVAGRHEGRDISLRIHRSGAGWTLNDENQPQVGEALDIDLSFTPATNLMPIRRLFDAHEATLKPRAAWLVYPDCRLEPLDQEYRRTGMPDVLGYAAQQTDFKTDLTVDRSGFVTLYPGLWEGEVTHAE